MAFHHLKTEEVLKALNSSAEGLNEQDVESSRKKHGPNEIPEKADRPAWLIFLKQFKSLLVVILLAAAGISASTGHLIDTFVILAVVLLNALIGFFQEFRAEKAIGALKKMVVSSARVLRAGEQMKIPARDLVPGDIIILEEGDSIPADARLLLSRNLRTIEASLTGESVPTGKKTDPVPDSTLMADQSNMVWKGTFVVGGMGHAIVTGTGINTALGEIADSLSTIRKGRTHFEEKTHLLARQMGFIAAGSALLLFVIGYFIRNFDVDEILLTSIAALVSAIPEGLPAILSVVLAVGARRMANRNALIREFSATESLGAVTAILTDKTGTLTQNVLSVQKVWVPGSKAFVVSGEGYGSDGQILDEKGEKIDEASLQTLLKIAKFSNNASIRKIKDSYELSGDPTEGALLAFANKGLSASTKAERFDDMPFNSDLKMRATLAQIGDQKWIMVVGAPEKVLERCTHTDWASECKELDKQSEESVLQTIHDWSDKAIRVIALAYKKVDTVDSLSKDDLEGLCLAGLTGMIDPPRTDVPNAIASCKKAGIRVIMATGDHAKTALAIAKLIGIVGKNDSEAIAVSENELEKMSEADFESTVQKVNVFARLSPNMKLRIAASLQANGELIAMTGDGVNDAPALTKADVGVAMGIMGTDVARSSAQVILADDNFSTIVHAVEEGRIVFTNARQTSFFLITTNFAEIATLITTIVIGFPVPLTATQILWLNLVTDGACGLALAVEKGNNKVLEEKPMNRKENILNKEIIPFLILNVITMAGLSILAFNYFFDNYGLEKARTAAFIVMASTQLFNAINMRNLKTSAFELGLFSNKWLNLAIAGSLLLQVLLIEIPVIQALFKFTTMSASEFTVLVLLASLVFWLGEIYKRVVARMNK
jgi:P-type Ca2+ transporter type 2C